MSLNRRAALMMVLSAAAAHAQPVSDFPARPIRLILGFLLPAVAISSAA